MLVWFCAVPATAQAQLNIADSPLFVNMPVTPAMMLAIDDSGSMDSEILVRSNDGALWWHTNRRSFVGLNQQDASESGVINFNLQGNASSTWKKYVYLFPNGTGLSNGRRAYSDSTNDHYAVPPIGDFAFTRSPVYNYSYFDPASDYQPWPDLGGLTFSDAAPGAAPTDAVLGSATMDLTTPVRSSAGNHTFRLYAGMEIPAGTVYRDWTDNTWKTATSPVPIHPGGADGDFRDVGIEYFPATFYLPATQTLPAGFGYVAPGIADGRAPDGSVLLRYEIRPENFASSAAYQAAIQNFANWFTYYRKRHAAARGAMGEAFLGIESFRVGAFTINNRPATVTIRDLTLAADRDALFADIYRNFIGSGGTPNRQAVNHMRTQFARTDSNAPIQYACQRNFGVLFTDGYANLWDGAGVGDRTAGLPAPFSNSPASNTMADIATALYQDNPRADLPTGQVPVPPGCNTANPDPSLDCNPNLHANLYAITMGTPGTIFNVDMAATEDPFANPPNWPTTHPNRNPSHVDDLWHATINSRGALLDVFVPTELGRQFRAILRMLGDRVTSGASVAANSTRLDTETRIYQARFSTEDWTGQLLSYGLESDGSIGTLYWDAADQMPAHDQRRIFTIDPDGETGTTFTWAALHDDWQSALSTSPTGTGDGLGPARLRWLRGDRAEEQATGGEFRDRSRTLGDIINSNPQFVGALNFGYESLPSSYAPRWVGTSPSGEPGFETNGYDAFRRARLNPSTGAPLQPTIYVGANDGMLHAFDAITGEERFAYVPKSVIPRLNRLPDPDYDHEYFVDGQVFVGDAYFDGQWRTVLVGTTGAGGRSVFALDVTDPSGFNETNVLWEFTHEELGYTIGEPVIAPMANGAWGVVFGNGYNSDSHRSSLFIVDLPTGQLIRRLDTERGDAASPNGLATPSLIPDGSRVVHAAFGGDLLGNVWKWNLSSSNTGNWESALRSGQTPQPLFQARDGSGVPQPITSMIEIGRHPEGGYLLLFGTGQYFAVGDNVVPANPQVQSFYGIWDRLGSSGNSSRITYTGGDRASVLQSREIIYEGPAGGGMDAEVRVTDQSGIDWSNKRGWYLDLRSPVRGPEGERMVSNPILRGGRVIFPTLIPSDDLCDAGGSSWLMELDAVTGSRLSYSPLDLNNDGSVDSDDYVIVIIDGERTPVPISGIRSREGIIQAPAIISAGEVEYKLASGTSGAVEVLRERGQFDRARGSWRQIR